MQGLLSFVPVFDGGDICVDFICELFGNGFSLFDVEFVIEKLQVYFTDIYLFVVEEGQLIGSVGNLWDLKEGSS